MSAKISVCAFALLSHLIALVGARAQCTLVLNNVGTSSNISQINLMPFDDHWDATSGAADIWSRDCGGMGTGYPALWIGPYSDADGTINVPVYYTVGRSPGACGLAHVTAAADTGQILSASIEIWSQEASGADCTATMSEIMAHEIGHIFGLDDVYAYPYCNGTIMGQNPYAVSSDQCMAVNNLWYTPWDVQVQQNFNECVQTCVQGTCDANGVCTNRASPILINLRGGPFRLTDVVGGVTFDIDGDGIAQPTAWTRSDARLAFLCLDRNGNGTIDSGAELFGNYTSLTSGELAPNGYVALAEYDSHSLGGNANGQIDSGDAIWSRLYLWTDTNHDGVSQPSELTTLASEGLTMISLTYRYQPRIDGYWNELKFRSYAEGSHENGGRARYITYDVFFRQ